MRCFININDNKLYVLQENGAYNAYYIDNKYLLYSGQIK